MRVWIAMIMMGLTGLAQAAIKTEQIDYKSADGTKLVGYYAYDDAVKGPRPGVLVVHEWWGLNDYAKRRARDLALQPQRLTVQTMNQTVIQRPLRRNTRPGKTEQEQRQWIGTKR